MNGQKWANLSAITGIIAGAAAIAGGLYAHSAQPVFGIPQFFGIYSNYLSGVHVLIGIGVIMVVGGLISFKWPSVGAIIVCGAAMLGLIYTYNRGQYRWTPYGVLLVGPRGCSPGSAASSPATRPTRTCRRAARSSPTRGTRRARSA